MLNVHKYREILLQEFYLDEDDVTVRRTHDGYKGRYKAGDAVKPYFAGRGKYPSVHIPKTKSSPVSLHQLIMLLRGIDVPEGMMIDHINGDVTDNTRSNLRIVSNKINSRNCKKRRNNKTGHSNISFNKQVGRYYVAFGHGSERLQKSAKTLEEAIQIKEEFKATLLSQGYTVRHCE
jgi:hypothetical protein